MNEAILKIISSLFICTWLMSCNENSQTPLSKTPLNKTPLSQTKESVSVVDFTGNTIRLNQAAKRIVALAPHVVENIYSAGAGNKLVGVVSYSNYPADALKLPIVGGYEQTNHEKIIELNPDLIIGWETGNSHSSLQRLSDLGYPVYIDQPNNLQDVAKSIRDIGVLSGTSDHANKIADQYLLDLAETRSQYKNAKLLRVFYQVWNSPLYTINGNHIISDAINICGGVNIYADEFAVSPVINIESLLERDPDVIIAGGMSSSRPEWLDDWKAWPSLKAVAKDNLFHVNPDHIQRHTARLLLGLDSICTQLDQARSR